MNEKKIIIIDDEIDIVTILEKFFVRRKKFQVVKFTNPLEAFESIKTTHYDLVLTDIMMPEMNGIELLKKIKEVKPELKVIMMTAFSTLDKTFECEKLGASDYVTKPFISLKDVENKILENLGL